MTPASRTRPAEAYAPAAPTTREPAEQSFDESCVGQPARERRDPRHGRLYGFVRTAPLLTPSEPALRRTHQLMRSTVAVGPHITVTTCPASHEVGPGISVLPGPLEAVTVIPAISPTNAPVVTLRRTRRRAIPGMTCTDPVPIAETVATASLQPSGGHPRGQRAVAQQH